MKWGSHQTWKWQLKSQNTERGRRTHSNTAIANANRPYYAIKK